MTLTVDLAPESLAALRDVAGKAGLEPDRYLARIVEEHLAACREAPLSLPDDDDVLLKQISLGLPVSTWSSYHALVAKRRAFDLTSAEHEELMALTNEVEMWNARRVELVAEWARRKGVPLAQMMAELGLMQQPDD